jgi:ankyrin repeat protein
MTPLMHAAWNGATAAVASLVELRANLDAQSSNG